MGAAAEFSRYIDAYRRRADAREAERLARIQQLRGRAEFIARELRAAYGKRVHVHLFGSLLDPDRFNSDSDIDLAVEGLSPSEYWDAWSRAEPFAGDAGLDLVRLETAAPTLREVVRLEGEELTG